MRYLTTLFVLVFASFNTYANCNGHTALELSECAQKEYEAEDKKLNQAYRKLTRFLDKTFDHDPEVKKQLVKAQRNWIKFRDDDCKFQYDMQGGGTIRMIVYPSCMRNHTKQRTQNLLDIIEYFEVVY